MRCNAAPLILLIELRGLPCVRIYVFLTAADYEGKTFGPFAQPWRAFRTSASSSKGAVYGVAWDPRYNPNGSRDEAEGIRMLLRLVRGDRAGDQQQIYLAGDRPPRNI